jgi:hypothetical protein
VDKKENLRTKKDYPQPSVLCELTGGKLQNRATGKLPNALNPQITQIHTNSNLRKFELICGQ